MSCNEQDNPTNKEFASRTPPPTHEIIPCSPSSSAQPWLVSVRALRIKNHFYDHLPRIGQHQDPLSLVLILALSGLL